MKNLVPILVLGLLIVTASGCNTVNGFGKDLGKLGNKIEEKSARK